MEREEREGTRSQIKLSRSREQEHTALEGKPLEEGSMPSSVVMSLDAGQMSGLLLVSANRQTGGTIVTRGHVFWRRCPMGKKLGPACFGIGQGMPVFPSLSFYPTLSVVGYRDTGVENRFYDTWETFLNN